jgi:hypothetical protein
LKIHERLNLLLCVFLKLVHGRCVLDFDLLKSISETLQLRLLDTKLVHAIGTSVRDFAVAVLNLLGGRGANGFGGSLGF